MVCGGGRERLAAPLLPAIQTQSLLAILFNLITTVNYIIEGNLNFNTNAPSEI